MATIPSLFARSKSKKHGVPGPSGLTPVAKRQATPVNTSSPRARRSLAAGYEESALKEEYTQTFSKLVDAPLVEQVVAAMFTSSKRPATVIITEAVIAYEKLQLLCEADVKPLNDILACEHLFDKDAHSFLKDQKNAIVNKMAQKAGK